MTRFISFIIILFSYTASSNTLLVLGDSLSAGYQMPATSAWPNLLAKDLEQKGFDYTVINASISGDTTGNGLDRLPDLLKQHEPTWVLIELGANDGLRGFHPNLINKNLQHIITISQQAEAKVALMQIQVPPNYGKRYSQAFSNIYPKLANEYQLPLLPFFLEQIILKDEWMKQDGLHPEEVAQPWIASYVADNLSLYLD
ncbi:arylesterase [Vibrio sp. MACH09]|uniref:multifunctional acyl-CoA thioesterase I/protease I/lysophospholipase L1 n=1 Tax=Vibrio sp. MACH09 TaxID=3025122 RepID=UPI00278F7DB5|nr:multifunctional acyl-CoA thioesterase I/protease I/lysophospholipase L1 [Vibrio sp. MACH09]GLO63630.1 arylesterase [Vibrio sp. MACH09]